MRGPKLAQRGKREGRSEEFLVKNPTRRKSSKGGERNWSAMPKKRCEGKSMGGDVTNVRSTFLPQGDRKRTLDGKRKGCGGQKRKNKLLKGRKRL